MDKDSVCKNCKRPIRYAPFVEEWIHSYGGSYCLDKNGFTATPIRKAEPVLETEVL